MVTTETFMAGTTPISPAEVIKRKRLNMLIHSYLYYWLDDPVWTDDKWQQCADELAALQEIYPDPIGFYDKEFADWSGATGMHLPKDDFVSSKALCIYRLVKERKSA